MQRDAYLARVMQLAEFCDVGERAFLAKLAGDQATLEALQAHWVAFEAALGESP